MNVRPVQFFLLLTAVMQMTPMRSCVIEKMVFGASCHDREAGEMLAVAGNDQLGQADASGCPEHEDSCVCKNLRAEASALRLPVPQLAMFELVAISSFPVSLGLHRADSFADGGGPLMPLLACLPLLN